MSIKVRFKFYFENYKAKHHTHYEVQKVLPYILICHLHHFHHDLFYIRQE